MGINHIELATGEVLMDLREDTVTEDSLLEGYTAHNAAGEIITGTKVFEKEVVIIPINFNENEEYYYIDIEDTNIIKDYKGETLLYLNFYNILIPFYEENTFILQTPSGIGIIEVNLETGICQLKEKEIKEDIIIIPGFYSAEKGYYISLDSVDIIKNYSGNFILYLEFQKILIPFFQNNVFIMHTSNETYSIIVDLNTGICDVLIKPFGSVIDWENIINKPTKISAFDNDKNYITETELNSKGYLDKIPDEYITETELNGKNYITETELNSKGYLDKIPNEYITETELNNKGYLDKVPDEYITETELNSKNYITSNDLSSYAQIENLSQVAKDGEYSSLKNIPTAFTPTTHEHDELYYTKEIIDTTSGQIQNLINKKIDTEDVLEVTETLLDLINTKADGKEIADIRATAEGKCKSYVLDNKEQLTEQLTTGIIDTKSLRKGDIFLLREIDWPDYWWEPIGENKVLEKYVEKDIIIEGKGALRILETAKINLDDYALVTDIPETLAELSDDSTHRLVTDAEKASWNAKSNFDGNYNSLNGKPPIPQAASHGYNGYIYTGSDGVAEMGKYIDFHNESNHTGDFSTRLTSTGNGNNLNLPSGGGTLTYGDKQYKIVVSNSVPTSTDTSIITFVI